MWLAVTAGFCSLWVVFFFYFFSFLKLRATSSPTGSGSNVGLVSARAREGHVLLEEKEQR